MTGISQDPNGNRQGIFIALNGTRGAKRGFRNGLIAGTSESHAWPLHPRSSPREMSGWDKRHGYRWRGHTIWAPFVPLGPGRASDLASSGGPPEGRPFGSI